VLGGDQGAREKLKKWLDPAQPRPSVDQLAALVDRVFQGDEGCREEFEGWFLQVRDHMIQSRRLREELKSTAYELTLRVAARKLEARYKDVQNDPASVASRVWEKKIDSFVTGLEEGRYDSVFQFIKWVDQASEYVILDLIRERNAAANGKIDDEQAILTASCDPHAAADHAEETESRREDQRALLRSVFQSLRGHDELFIILILNRFAGLSTEEVGEIMAIGPRVVRNRLSEAVRIIGEAVPGPD
jgi:DNA-directed RNA polymerase specialized sigma24 family protein